MTASTATPLVVLVASEGPALTAWATERFPGPDVALVPVAAPALVSAAASTGAAVALTDAPVDAALADRLARAAPEAQLVPLRGVEPAEREVLVAGVVARAARFAAVRREADGFTSALCHDLRSQLQGIVGLAGLLAEVEGPNLSPEGRDYCERLEATGEGLARMAQDLLELARLGRQPRRSEPVDLNDATEQARARLALEPATPPAAVRVPEPLPPVSGDPVLLTAALVHLVRNAAQHDPAPSAGVTVGWRPLGGGRGVLAVADRGPGLPPAALARVFQPFHREPGTPRPGAGLGLAFVARVAALHGGRAWAEANPGGGCVVCLELPLAEGPAAPAPAGPGGG